MPPPDGMYKWESLLAVHALFGDEQDRRTHDQQAADDVEQRGADTAEMYS